MEGIGPDSLKEESLGRQLQPWPHDRNTPNTVQFHISITSINQWTRPSLYRHAANPRG